VSQKILFVDDEVNILSGIARQQRKRFDIWTAVGGKKGLEVMKEEGPFAIVVADMNMPGMNGIEFLSEVRKCYPDTVRMMLTGNADQQTAVDAVNQGAIFRFFTKPCPAEIISDALNLAMQQYELITAERVLLERTLAGSVKVLVDVLALFDADAFAGTVRIRRWLADLLTTLKYGNRWELDVAAMLSPIGQMTLPPEITAKLRKGEALAKAEEDLVRRAPAIGKRLIANIPRLEAVSNLIYYQNKGYDGSGFPVDEFAGQDIPFGARLLKILGDLARFDKEELPSKGAFESLEANDAQYDPELLAKVRERFLGNAEEGGAETAEPAILRTELKVNLDQLRPDDKTVTQIVTKDGILILDAGHVLTELHIERLKNYQKTVGLREPIHVARVVQEVEEKQAS
jgi:response regulator RpfG family c-di-GMP phosphodiesterase